MELRASFPAIPDAVYSGCIKLLVEAGAIEATGDLNRMRFSEIRIPGSSPEGSK